MIAENPGLGVGPEWIDKSIKQIMNIDFAQYCSCSNPEFAYELKALFIIAAKDGGKRSFLITENIPMFFSLVLCCYGIEWSNELKNLRRKANSFIRKKKKNTPFWQNYPLFSDTDEISPFSIDSRIAARIADLTPMARLHLLSFAEKGVASLMKGASHKMRSLGLNPLETAPVILASDLCELIADFEVVKDIYSKNDLITLLEEKGIDFKKSWKKGQLLEAIASRDPAFVDQVSDREKIVRIKPEYQHEFYSMVAHAKTMQKNIELLCFA
ncbi:MAG: hypothetical protein KKB30_14765 [Proteobacteria bacterium]|nr:hypothetical protein [Pseudomonadota bacterium]MBU1715708.1 hypothetical protein [Pseudomonadota bacterium]